MANLWPDHHSSLVFAHVSEVNLQVLKTAASGVSDNGT